MDGKQKNTSGNSISLTWSPPEIAFPIVWAVNNIASVFGTMRLANLLKGFPNRKEEFLLQSFIRISVTIFSLITFRLKSSWLGSL